MEPFICAASRSQVDVGLDDIRRRKRLLDMKAEVRQGQQDNDLADLHRRKRLHEMRHDPETVLAVMRERRRRLKTVEGETGGPQQLAAEYRASTGGRPERREFRTSINVDGRNRIAGYAAVFNSLSQPMKIGSRSFRERILPGAFDQCLNSNPDIKGLLNHDPNYLLGRTTSGTMSVTADGRGLRYVITPPNTSYANDLLESMKRGDLDASSFGFYTTKDNWLVDGSETIREIVSADVVDCSPVTFPAYPAATSAVV